METQKLDLKKLNNFLNDKEIAKISRVDWIDALTPFWVKISNIFADLCSNDERLNQLYEELYNDEDKTQGLLNILNFDETNLYQKYHYTLRFDDGREPKIIYQFDTERFNKEKELYEQQDDLLPFYKLASEDFEQEIETLKKQIQELHNQKKSFKTTIEIKKKEKSLKKLEYSFRQHKQELADLQKSIEHYAKYCQIIQKKKELKEEEKFKYVQSLENEYNELLRKNAFIAISRILKNNAFVICFSRCYYYQKSKRNYDYSIISKVFKEIRQQALDYTEEKESE